MDNNIYLLYSCNQWKECSSMSLLMASTDENKIREEVITQVKNNDMKYEDYQEDLVDLCLHEMSNRLEYGYIETVVDGERQH